jgi:hypothetical protein
LILLGYASVKDSLFKDDRYKQMMKVPVEGIDAEFEMDAGTVVKRENRLPVLKSKWIKLLFYMIRTEILYYRKDRLFLLTR